MIGNLLVASKYPVRNISNYENEVKKDCNVTTRTAKLVR